MSKLQSRIVKLKKPELEHKRAETRLKKELAAITAVIKDMLSGDVNGAQTEERVLDTCLKTTDSVYGMIGAINEKGKYDTTTYNSQTLHDCAFPEALAWEVSTGMTIRGIWGWPMQNGKPLICNDLSAHPDRVGLPKGHVQLESFLGVPLMHEGKVVGMVAVANKPDGYTKADKDTLIRLASVISVSRQHRLALAAAEKTSEELEQLVVKRTKQLWDAHKRLEHRVQERTAELQTANKELESFSYSVSHDLRVPLRAIDGFSRILIDDFYDKLDDEGKRLLNIVRDSANKMGQLIDDLLAFSRIGRKEMALSKFNMVDLVKTVVKELKPSVVNQTVKFEINPLPPAYGDRAMIHQVFINFLSNAIKYSSPNETAFIEIGGRTEEDENTYYVKDNGVGFDMQYVNKLFGVFQRLHGQEEFEGTGIGLATVQRIIHKHGGKVWAKGKVNEGATFCFSLPSGK